MKKVILLPLMVILLVGVANAALFNNFLSLNYQDPDKVQQQEQQSIECDAEQLFKSQVIMANSMPIFLDALKAFDDGDHVVYLKQNEYNGEKYFTVHKNSGKIIWIKSGLCSAENGYDSYTVNFDIEQIQLSGSNMIQQGYNLLKQIDGISTIQKLKLVKTTVIYGLTSIEALNLE